MKRNREKKSKNHIDEVFARALSLNEQAPTPDQVSKYSQNKSVKAEDLVLQKEVETLFPPETIVILKRAIEIANQAGVPFPEAHELLDHLNSEVQLQKDPKIFISYSRNDIAIAQQIYWFLKKQPCIPWMD